MVKIPTAVIVLAVVVYQSHSQSPACLLPKKTGECKAAHSRWYFDLTRKECKPFLYGGCRGNENNFETKDDCENKCLVKETTPLGTTSSSNNTSNVLNGDLHVFYCPEAFGLFHDDYQCDKYYECNGGVSTEKLCPDGLLFSPAREDCDYPFEVECGSRLEQQPPQRGIDKRCLRANGLYPDARQCDLYFECIDGVAHEQLCPDGLLFYQGCDYPFHVDCEDRKLLQKPQAGIDRQCKRANGFFDHESDCNRYYNCVNGTAYELRCRSGLIFDYLTGDCIKLTAANAALRRNCERP